MFSLDAGLSTHGVKLSVLKHFNAKLAGYVGKFCGDTHTSSGCNCDPGPVQEIVMPTQVLVRKPNTTPGGRISSDVIDSDCFNTSSDLIPLSPPGISQFPSTDDDAVVPLSESTYL